MIYCLHFCKYLKYKSTSFEYIVSPNLIHFRFILQNISMLTTAHERVVFRICKGNIFAIMLACKILWWRFKIFPKQAIGTISSSTRILSKKMMNALISLNYLFSYISKSQYMMKRSLIEKVVKDEHL